jgi:hypothetical protein
MRVTKAIYRGLALGLICVCISCHQPIRRPQKESSIKLSFLVSDDSKANIVIRVVDPAEKGIQAASIVLFNDQDQTICKTKTDAKGTATILEVPPQQVFTIFIKSKGFSSVVQEKVSVPSSTTLHIAAKLYPIRS